MTYWAFTTAGGDVDGIGVKSADEDPDGEVKLFLVGGSTAYLDRRTALHLGWALLEASGYRPDPET